jgi:isoquinoline 1-oxidoreductase subunit beta
VASALAAGSFAVGFHLLAPGKPIQAGPGRTVNSWITIGKDEFVTVFVSKAEMGQGIHTAMAMLVAEELEVDWEKVRVAPAPVYPEFFLGDIPVTSGSRSVIFAYQVLREAGAVAREMLIAAAARQWGLEPSDCVAKDGFVQSRNGKAKLSYGKLAPAAARLVPPPVPPLKRPENCRLLGQAVQRLDTPAKTDGTAAFGIDVALPEMLVAAVKTSPAFGGELQNLDELKKSAPEGVFLLPIANGIAAASKSYWLSQNALESLDLRFGKAPAPESDSAEITQGLWAALEDSGPKDEVAQVGNTGRARAGADKVVSADYEAPFLAHATMEPPACVADVKDDGCELWVGTKSVVYTRTAAAEFLGLPHHRVKVNPHLMGGSFGRKGESDFVLQAVSLSKALRRPVKVIWSREEDIRHDFYRPAAVARFSGAVKNGRIVAWEARNAVASFKSVQPGVDNSHLDSLRAAFFADLEYRLPNLRVSSVLRESPVPVGFWRSTAASHNTFFVESFFDELARAAGRDPLEMRLELLAYAPAKVAVLKKAAEAAGWGNPLPRGRARGVAFLEAKGTRIAQVAETSSEGGKIQVHKVFCAYDCGPIVNPDTIEAQIEGGIIFGLSACLYGKITIRHGGVEQGNFDDYRTLLLADCPEITVVRVESGSPPGGIGEAGVPLIAPAVANAHFQLTGKRLRKMPFLGS